MREKRYRILYVGNDRKLRNSFTELFGGMYRVYTADTGRSGFKVLCENHLDTAVVIANQPMPRRNKTGVQFLARCRVNFPNIVRILISGYANHEAVVAAINECEVYRCVEKPWDQPALESILKSAVIMFENGRQPTKAVYPVITLVASGRINELPRVLTSMPFKKAKRVLANSFAKLYVQTALHTYGGNLSATARVTGIHRKTIQRIRDRR